MLAGSPPAKPTSLAITDRLRRLLILFQVQDTGLERP
jgi:hypothetical protein